MESQWTSGFVLNPTLKYALKAKNEVKMKTLYFGLLFLIYENFFKGVHTHHKHISAS